MKKQKSFLKYELLSIIITSILGVILHFSYEWSGNNLIVGSFSAVNESIWEHLKLIFFPTLITIIGGIFYNKDNFEKYLSSKTKGLLCSLAFIVVFYYTYKGILGYSIAFVDIILFFVAIIIGEIITIKNFMNPDSKSNYQLSIIVLTILLILFITFTYHPPKIGLFQDPITGTYGIFLSHS